MLKSSAPSTRGHGRWRCKIGGWWGRHVVFSCVRGDGCMSYRYGMQQLVLCAQTCIIRYQSGRVPALSVSALVGGVVSTPIHVKEVFCPFSRLRVGLCAVGAWGRGGAMGDGVYLVEYVCELSWHLWNGNPVSGCFGGTHVVSIGCISSLAVNRSY